MPDKLTMDTQPRPLSASELEDWHCSDCGEPAASGTQHLEDRGPFQQINVHNLTCTNRHHWDNTTDGS
jgi:hypothetical protein